jgi:organic radical activating enzyme
LNEFGIVSEMISNSVGCKKVVLTGGEPTLQDLNPLVDLLHMFDYSVHIETNGIEDPYSILAKCDWITVSPKGVEACWDETDLVAEVKFLIGFPNDINLIEAFGKLNCKMYVQPIHSVKEFETQENIQKAVKFCTDHPDYSLSLQLHKIIGVK